MKAKSYRVFHIIYTGQLLIVTKRLLLKILQKLFNKKRYQFIQLILQHKYTEAAELSQLLIKDNSNNIRLYKDTAFALFYSGQIELSTQYMRESLEMKLGMPFEQFINNSYILPEERKQISEVSYVYLGGYANYGFVKHGYKEPQDLYLLSKVVQYNSDRIKNKEQYFYENICYDYRQLDEIVPKLIKVFKFKERKIMFITTEYINGSKPDNVDVKEVLKCNSVIESISYEQAKNFFNYTICDRTKYHAMYLHKKNICLEMISNISSILSCNHTEYGMDYVKRLKDIVVNGKMYKHIIPYKHYAFCHNDFHRNNIITYKGKCYIIDWNSYSYAMKGWDMAYFFGNFEFTFAEICTLYIDEYLYKNNEKSSVIGTFFYIFLQIYIWSNRLRERSFTDRTQEFFLPALSYMEKLYNEI